MPLNAALGAMVFFYRLGKDLSSHILRSLDKVDKSKLTTQQQQTLEANGDGINQFIDLQEEKFSILTKRLIFLHTKQ
jgi:hypothetical protein